MTADDLAEKVAAALGEAVTEHAAHMETYTLPALQPGFMEGWNHALRLLTRDAGFIGSKAAAALVPLIREREAAAWERALETVAAGVESAMEAHREHGHRESVSTLSGLLTAISRTANPYAGSEGER